MPARRTRASVKIAALLLGLAFALAVGEVVLRLIPVRPIGELYYQDADRKEATPADAEARGLIIAVDPAENPRGRKRFAPNAHFHLCYRGHPRGDWFDDQGCVDVQLNRYGLRERDDLTVDNKRPGEQRILCVGDSFTFGWGVPVEQCWVRLLEEQLRAGGRDVRTINCGAAGAINADEYWWAIRNRFGAFQPDAVVITLCLNDLLPCSGLCLIGPPPKPTGSVLLDRFLGLFRHDPLDLDPGIDWVDLLEHTPKENLEASGLVGTDNPYAAMWVSGAPQKALRETKAWCAERHIPLLVVVWPFFQGLAAGKKYPFERAHAAVRDFCAQEQLPFLDLLPVFRGHEPSEFWVTPADMHANPRAHRLALGAITPFAKTACGY